MVQFVAMRCAGDGSMSNFIEKWAAGEVTEEDIHDYISRWHAGAGSQQSLHEFLGMSFAQYKRWVEQRGTLREILGPRTSASAPKKTRRARVA